MATGTETSDAELVSESLVGNRDAFGQIVARYQSLVCSLAYCSTGCLGQSEDLAQETFFTAWKHLDELRERAMLRPWLCGIARNCINNNLRRESRKPLTLAEPLETARDEPAPGPVPAEQAITREEEAILWRSLERVPATYREPLVLFYREHQSIERVAEGLDLSEDAVKQRLSRGRKLLHEQVLTFVEDALARTTPGKAFTLGVLAALPVFATSASAATVGLISAKAGTAAKAAVSTGMSGAALWILGPLTGIFGAWFGAKASIENTHSPRERKFMIGQVWVGGVYILFFLAALFALILLGRPLARSHPVVLGVATGTLALGYVFGLLLLIARGNRRQHQIQLEDGTVGPSGLFGPAVSDLTGKPLQASVHGSLALAASTMGALTWLAVLAGRAGDWSTAVLVVLFGVVVSLTGIRAWWRRPEHWLRIQLRTLAALGLFTLMVFNLRWSDWVETLGIQEIPQQQLLLGVNLSLVVIYALAVIGVCVMKRGLRSRFHSTETGPTGSLVLLAGLLSSLGVGTGCQRSLADKPAVNSMTLSNGVRVVSVCLPASTNASIFTFLPIGLTSDGPDQVQCSHLVEHLVIRSTTPANSPEANGETLPDHLRLDFYGNLANWKEGLSHHRRWLEGVPFTEASLAAEKPNVIAECDFAARNLATHKFAAAAWSHGLRHSKRHVALKADVKRAGLSDVQRLRDERLVVSNQVTVCVVSGLKSAEVFAGVQRELGGLRLRSVLSSAVKTTPQSLDLTWDLDARHLLVTWSIPDCRQEDHAALMVGGHCLNMLLASDPQVTQQAGMILAGSDLTTPEGDFFFVSASLRPGSTFADVCKAIQTHVGRLSSDASTLAQAPFIASQLAASLTTLPNSELIKAQLPPGISMAMVEGNLGLTLGMSEHRYGAHRPALARQLATVAAGKVQQAVRTHLAQEKCWVCTLTAAQSPSTGN